MKKKLEKIDEAHKKKKVRKYKRDSVDFKTNKIYVWKSLNTLNNETLNENKEKTNTNTLPKNDQVKTIGASGGGVSRGEKIISGQVRNSGPQQNRGNQYNNSHYSPGPSQHNRGGINRITIRIHRDRSSNIEEIIHQTIIPNRIINSGINIPLSTITPTR